MLRLTIKEFLEDLGCEVYDFARGDLAIDTIYKSNFDAYAIDIDVPGTDGYGVLGALRAIDVDAPAIFITASIDIENIIKAYDLGCTDYIKKPFKLQELWLRINQALKVCKKDAGFVALGESLRYDKKGKRLLLGSAEITLAKKHTQILCLLIASIGSSIPIESFRQCVWGRDDVDDATIRTEINRLRKIAPQLSIKNIKGIGYKLERR